MKMTKYLSGDYMNMEFAKTCEGQEGVILSPAEEKEYEGKRAPVIMIEILDQRKEWRLNRTTIRNFAETWKDDSVYWAGKKFQVKVEKVQGKDAIVGYPV